MKSLTQTLTRISIEGTIIDIETTGLEPSTSYLTTFGYVSKGDIRIFQLAAEHERPDLVTLTRALLSGYSALPRPYYAYNKEFEEKWLGTKIDVDLMEYWRKASDKIAVKWPKLRELTSIPFNHLREAFRQSDAHRGLDLALDEDRNRPDILWNRFLESHDALFLDAIMLHNFFDLLREASLLLWDPNQWNPPLRFDISG